MAVVSITGVAELDAKLATMTERHQNKLIRRAARVIAKDVRDSAQDHAPVQYGTLEDSIRVRAMRRSRKNKDVVGLRVITSDSDSLFAGETFYGGFQEYGTKHMTANPFLLPAMLENEGTAVNRFRTEMTAILNEEAKS